MSERDYAPLSSACVRALQDKLQDKRKTAASEIEKMVKDFAAVNNTGQIRRLVRILQEFATSQNNSHARRGGLIGLSAVAIALGKDCDPYIDDLITSILGCLSDQDLRVRYSACEALYNVVKVARNSILGNFSAIFNALSKVATDPDQSIKNASELLDRLLKDIVADSNTFDLEGFLPLLRERMYARNSFARQFVIMWISVLNMVPTIDLLPYLPQILDGLFKILSDPAVEVKKNCETTLGEFLRSIKNDHTRVNFGEMINTLILHAQDKNDDLVQFTAITWIKEFVQLSGYQMLPHMSGIFTAVLPCLSYDTENRRKTDIKETATAINFNLMKLISLQEENKNVANDDNSEIQEELDLESVVDVLSQYLMHNSIQTKVAVLKWIHDLYIKIPNKMVDHIKTLFPALQRTLSDESDQVVQQCLVVIAEVISSPANNFGTGDSKIKRLTDDSSSYYKDFVLTLLQTFSKDKRLLDERGSFIIRQLCILLNAEDIYRTLAQILLTETNLKFASLMVEHLNMILLTSPELFELRNELKELKNEKACSLFCCLYETWCHNPVATVSLCLLTQGYNHACDLIKLFGSLEITVDFLTEIDKLVQLIESPIFAFLRLELLEVPCDKNLVRALYGLLMLLPQTQAFESLRIRLNCIPSLHIHCDQIQKLEHKSPSNKCKNIDFGKLLNHFTDVQDKHKEYKKAIRAKDVLFIEKEVSNLEF